MRYADHALQAVELIKAGKLPEAEDILNAMLGHFPDDPMALFLLGGIYQTVRRTGIAIPIYRQAVALMPEFSDAWHNLGVCYHMEEKKEEARAAYMRSLELAPDNANTMAMIAGTYVNMGDPGPGVEWAKKALQRDGDNPHARNHLALCLLEQNKAEGWAHYERRWEVPDRAKDVRKYPGVPKWDGQTPVGRLVLHGEQGLGDEILFLTCVDAVLGEHATLGLCDELVIEASPRLVPLLRRSLYCEVYGTHDEVMKHSRPDAWMPLGDLPRHHQPVDGQMLEADDCRVRYWRDRIEALGPPPYIACAWGGGMKMTNRSQRETDLKDWRPILGLGTFISVHYRPEASEEAFIAGVHHFPEAIEDLDEMAALIAACDMTITVCQTAVHLSGALGKPTWVLTPKACAWRYRYNCTEDRMNWYPDVRLYRQEKAGEWGPVIERVRRDLQALARSEQQAA